MDIQTQDGILLQNIPDGTPDEAIKARIQQLRYQDAVKNRGWGTGLHGIAYGAGEKVSDAATRSGSSPEVSAAFGAGANVLTQSVPAFLSGGTVGNAAKPAMEGLGRFLMGSAIKATQAERKSGDAAQAIETMLQQGYSPTKGGVAAMQEKISALGDEVSQAIAGSTATVNKAAVGQRLKDAYDKFKAQVNPEADLKAIRQAWDEFKNHPDLAGKLDIPVQLAQALKQGTYRALGNKNYGELSGASTEAQKQLARGLKEEVSAAVPSVEKANNAQAELINAKEVAERRALLEGNKDPLPLGAGIGAALNNPMASLGLWANSSAFAKSALARMLYSGPQAAGAGVGTGATVLSGAGQAPTEQQLLAEQLRKKQQRPAPQPMFSPEDASLPIASR